MRPLVGIRIEPDAGLAIEPEEVAQTLAEYAAHEWGGQVALALLATEEELAGFQAGHLVLYRKPVRSGKPGELGYRRADGSVVKLQQDTLFGESGGAASQEQAAPPAPIPEEDRT